MAEKYEVVKSLWHNHIGIVKIKTLYFGYKYYIGLGAGLDQEQDEQKVSTNKLRNTRFCYIRNAREGWHSGIMHRWESRGNLSRIGYRHR